MDVAAVMLRRVANSAAIAGSAYGNRPLATVEQRRPCGVAPQVGFVERPVAMLGQTGEWPIETAAWQNKFTLRRQTNQINGNRARAILRPSLLSARRRQCPRGQSRTNATAPFSRLHPVSAGNLMAQQLKSFSPRSMAMAGACPAGAYWSSDSRTSRRLSDGRLMPAGLVG
jgi:hypothetical protein